MRSPQAGKHVGETVKRLVAGEPAEPFSYWDKGTMATIGRGAAVVELPFGQTLTGPVAWMAWLGVHLGLLSGMQEKTNVFLEWGWNLFTRKRGKQIILDDSGTDTGSEWAAAAEAGAPRDQQSRPTHLPIPSPRQ